MPEIKYGPVGKCIYCAAPPPAVLTDEHIIPLALGGEHLLLKASCKPCEKITGRFEGIVLRGGLRPILRDHTRMPTCIGRVEGLALSAAPIHPFASIIALFPPSWSSRRTPKACRKP